MPNIRTLGRRIPRVNIRDARGYAARRAEFNAGNLYGVYDLGYYKIFSYHTMLVLVDGERGWENQSYYSATTSKHMGVARAALRGVTELHGFAYRGERGHAATVDWANRALS